MYHHGMHMYASFWLRFNISKNAARLSTCICDAQTVCNRANVYIHWHTRDLYTCRGIQTQEYSHGHGWHTTGTSRARAHTCRRRATHTGPIVLKKIPITNIFQCTIRTNLHTDTFNRGTACTCTSFYTFFLFFSAWVYNLHAHVHSALLSKKQNCTWKE